MLRHVSFVSTYQLELSDYAGSLTVCAAISQCSSHGLPELHVELSLMNCDVSLKLLIMLHNVLHFLYYYLAIN
jgi:hypothetical protein